MKTFWLTCTLIAGTASLGTYVYATAKGKTFGSPTQRFVPRDIHSSPTGYRSFHFWHSGSGGYRGGK